MARQCIFVLDVGKSNVKALVFDAQGTQLFERSVRNAILPGPPYPHADIGSIWSFCLAALRDAGGSLAIDAIVVTTHGATAALVDAGGLVLPVLDYEHAAIAGVEDTYSLMRPPFAQTFSPPLGGGLNLGRQLAWQRQHFAAAFAGARHLLMYPQYWTWRMTGTPVLEATSLGAHTDLWQPLEGRPSAVAQALGLTGILPPLVRAYDVVGVLKSDIAAACHLRHAPVVLAGIHDSNASILPHLARRTPPFTVISTGTWVILFGLGLPLGRLDPGRDQLANIDVEGRPVACGRFMGGREYAAIAGDMPAVPVAGDVLDILRRGVLALPNFAGGSGPFPGHRARIVGEAAGQQARAALATLYVALMTDYSLDLLGATQGDLIVEGSFADNALYGALLKALRPQQAVRMSQGAAGTARGAAMLANWPPPVPLPDTSARAQPWPDVAALHAYRQNWRSHVDAG